MTSIFNFSGERLAGYTGEAGQPASALPTPLARGSGLGIYPASGRRVERDVCCHTNLSPGSPAAREAGRVKCRRGRAVPCRLSRTSCDGPRSHGVGVEKSGEPRGPPQAAKSHVYRRGGAYAAPAGLGQYRMVKGMSVRYNTSTALLRGGIQIPEGMIGGKVRTYPDVKRILFISRHYLLPVQIAVLQRKFPHAEIIHHTTGVRDVNHVQELIEQHRADEIIVILPLSIIKELCKRGIYPLYPKMQRLHHGEPCWGTCNDLNPYTDYVDTKTGIHHRFVKFVRVKDKIMVEEEI